MDTQTPEKLLEGYKNTHTIITNGLAFFDESSITGYEVAEAHEYRQWLVYQKDECEKAITDLGGSVADE